jgi:hypothetical protein
MQGAPSFLEEDNSNVPCVELIVCRYFCRLSPSLLFAFPFHYAKGIMSKLRIILRLGVGAPFAPPKRGERCIDIEYEQKMIRLFYDGKKYPNMTAERARVIYTFEQIEKTKVPKKYIAELMPRKDYYRS